MHKSSNSIASSLVHLFFMFYDPPGKKFLQKSSVGLAEHREMELQSFFKQLLEGNPLVRVSFLFQLTPCLRGKVFF